MASSSSAVNDSVSPIGISSPFSTIPLQTAEPYDQSFWHRLQGPFDLTLVIMSYSQFHSQCGLPFLQVCPMFSKDVSILLLLLRMSKTMYDHLTDVS